jgi:P-type conjugative transfer protein TrbL
MNPTFFQQILAPFAIASASWIAPILALGTPIFWMLATLELCTVFAVMLVKHDLMGMAEDLTVSLAGIGVGYVIFENAAPWGLDLAQTFGILANETAGLGAATSPDGLMHLGLALATAIWSAIGYGSWLTMPVTSFIACFVGDAVFIIFVWVAIKLTLLLAEVFVAVIGGSIFLPFGAFRFTHQLVGTWINWIIGVGVQTFITFLMLSIAFPMITNWVSLLTGSFSLITSSWIQSMIILAQAFVFWMLIVQMPKQARMMVSGAVSPFTGLGTAMGVIGAALGSAEAVANTAIDAAAAILEPGSFTGATQENLNKMLRST